MTLPILGLMLGDATGIGPEVSAKVLASGFMREKARVAVFGDARLLALGVKDAGVRLDWRTYERVADIDWSDAAIPFIDLKNQDPAQVTRGQVDADAGRVAGETLKHMVDLALAGELDGVTFAPLNKAGLNKGGWKYPDEHQMFAAWVNHQGYFGEMNVLKGLWTSRVTSHVAFKRIMELLTPERIGDAIRLSYNTLRRVGVSAPRIGVAALNPHGGEGGLFGDEEMTLIGPAVKRAQAEGINAEGPFPADTIFLKAFAGQFDSVVSMYHDQGQIATKLTGFNQGVTVTSGLKVVFTTSSHGTAYDIVGQGKANTGALEHALELASRLARNK